MSSHFIAKLHMTTKPLNLHYTPEVSTTVTLVNFRFITKVCVCVCVRSFVHLCMCICLIRPLVHAIRKALSVYSVTQLVCATYYIVQWNLIKIILYNFSFH